MEQPIPQRRFVDFRRQPTRSELKRLVSFDQLTGLKNKASRDADLKQELNLFERGSSDFAFVYIDIDNFKKVNDMIGHELADKVLKQFAKVTKEVLRSSDTTYRDHGDEFQIILRSIDPDRTNELEDRVKEKLRKSFSRKMEELGEIYSLADLSIGFSYPNKDDNPTDLIKRADDSMRNDKKMRKKNR